MVDDDQNSQLKVKINVNKLKPGMKIARDVEYEFGGVFLPAGTIVDEYNINRLQRLDSQYVYIFDEAQEKIEANFEKIKDTELNYQQSVDRMETVFQRIRAVEEIKHRDVKDLTSEVSSLGNENEMLDLLTEVREADQYTYSHLINVGMLAYMFGGWVNLKEKRRLELTRAGLIHDVGKAKIPDQILNKPGQLTEKEYEKIKKHSIYGYKMAKNAEFISEEIARGILTHHERYNGSGYPLGIKGTKIPFFGRSLAIVDTFDAITSDRIYQPGSSPFKAIKLFKEETPGMFDYRLLKIFLEKIPNYFINQQVWLNNGQKAEVVFINPRHPDKPIIKVDDNYIDLYNNDNLKVKKLIK